jgi:N-acetyl-anhydromuramyl-L-alanine amidase AmpD
VSDIVHMPSPNFDARDCAISHIILHYTDMPDADAALARLCDPTAKVSAHYLIRRDGQAVQLVDEAARAWHAGVSYWRGQTDMNAASIGIELDHDGHDAAGNMAAFPAAQMRALIALVADIVARHALDPRHILGHSDIAPGRKIDPGEAFDWAALARAGFGFWLDDIKIEDVPTLASGSTEKAVAPLQKALAAFGYRIVADGHFGPQTQAVITAFQRHFRPAKITGTADAETQSLIYEYCCLIG